MADQDDFTFDEQDSDSEEWYEEEPEKKKKGGSRSRILLLLLLLVVIAAGGYYFTMMPADEDGPAAPPKQVVKLKKKPVTMPTKPTAVKPGPAPVEKPAPTSAEKTAMIPPKPVDKPGPGSAPAETPEKDPVKAQSMPIVKEKTPAPMPEKVAEKPILTPVKQEVTPKKIFETTDAPKPVKVAMPSEGPYTLSVGTYMLQSSVRGVTAKIRSVGYEPVITPVKRKVTMTRLKVGTYPKAQAAAKMAELQSVVPGVFSVRKGDVETVYAGSYLLLDKARRFADTLYKKGIKLEEEPIQVEKTLHRVTFGSFASPEEAKEVARQAAAKGVEAKVFKNH